MLREILDKTAERVGKELKDQPAVEAALRATIGEVYHALGDYAKAEGMGREALILLQKLHSNEHEDVATALNNLASVLSEQGQHSEAVAMLRESLAMRKNLLGNEHPNVATALNNLAA